MPDSSLRERPIAILPGQYFDAETGLHQNWYRDYDPELGRYLQSDPLGMFAGVNTYAYASNNPLRNIDPYGLKDVAACEQFSKGIPRIICNACVDTYCKYSPAAPVCCVIKKDECIGNAGDDSEKLETCMVEYVACTAKNKKGKDPVPKMPEDI